MIASFRFLFKSIAGYAYGRLLTNVGKALPRSFSGMALDGSALKKGQNCRRWFCPSCKFESSQKIQNTENKAQMKRPEPVRPALAGRTGSGRAFGLCLNGGCVKGATPLVFICPLHINTINN